MAPAASSAAHAAVGAAVVFLIAVCGSAAASAGAYAPAEDLTGLAPLEAARRASTPVAAFDVPREGAGRAAVRVGPVTCMFTFETTKSGGAATTAAKSEVSGGSVPSGEALLAGLKGRCLTYRQAFWEYSVCIGDRVTQSSANEQFVLGYYSSSVEHKQQYTGGTVCAALPNSPERTTEVQYGCGKREQVASVQEIGTCKYQAIVLSPALCGNSMFPDMSVRGDNNAGGTDVQSDVEPWVVEVDRAFDGAYTCRAYSTDDIKKGSSGASVSPLQFVKWSLDMMEVDEFVEGTREAKPLGPVAYAARKANRQVVDANAVAVHTPGGATVPASLSGGGDSSDGLEFVSLDVECPGH